jgi:hypothetical protein
MFKPIFSSPHLRKPNKQLERTMTLAKGYFTQVTIVVVAAAAKQNL